MSVCVGANHLVIAEPVRVDAGIDQLIAQKLNRDPVDLCGHVTDGETQTTTRSTLKKLLSSNAT